jgi:hypothetical protein
MQQGKSITREHYCFKKTSNQIVETRRGQLFKNTLLLQDNASACCSTKIQ